MPHVFCGHVLGKPAGTDALPIGILPTAVAEPKWTSPGMRLRKSSNVLPNDPLLQKECFLQSDAFVFLNAKN